MSDDFWRVIASLRIETPEGSVTVVDGRTLHLVERLEAPRRYMLHVLRAIVEQLQRRGICAECGRPLRSRPTQQRPGMRCLSCARKGNAGRFTSTEAAQAVRRRRRRETGP